MRQAKTVALDHARDGFQISPLSFLQFLKQSSKKEKDNHACQECYVVYVCYDRGDGPASWPQQVPSEPRVDDGEGYANPHDEHAVDFWSETVRPDFIIALPPYIPMR